VKVGLNTTLTEQLLPTGTRTGQLPLRANWPGLTPPMVIDLIGNTTVPVLLIVMVCAVLVALRTTFPNPSVLGETKYAAAWMPVPESATLLIPCPPPAVTVIFAVFGPMLVGLNVTLMVQELPPGTDAPQLCVSENWVGVPPDTTIDVIGNAALAALLSTIVAALEGRFSG
jgi:hypothetical protein